MKKTYGNGQLRPLKKRLTRAQLDRRAKRIEARAAYRRGSNLS